MRDSPSATPETPPPSKQAEVVEQTPGVVFPAGAPAARTVSACAGAEAAGGADVPDDESIDENGDAPARGLPFVDTRGDKIYSLLRISARHLAGVAPVPPDQREVDDETIALALEWARQRKLAEEPPPPPPAVAVVERPPDPEWFGDEQLVLDEEAGEIIVVVR